MAEPARVPDYSITAHMDFAIPPNVAKGDFHSIRKCTSLFLR